MREKQSRAFLSKRRNINYTAVLLGLWFRGRRLKEIGGARDGEIDEENRRAGCDDTH